MMLRALALVVLMAAPVQAKDVVSDQIAELRAGVICSPEVIDRVPAPGTIAGVQNVIDGDPPFVSMGRAVPAVIGIGFAIRSRAAEQAFDGLRMEVTHPPMGPDGTTHETYVSSIGTVGLSLTAWQFEHDYELVTGPWTIRAWDGDRMLYSVTFDVVAPEMLPELASLCGYGELLS